MNFSTTRARMLTVAGIGVAAVVVIGGTATAASEITSHQLATGAVNSRVIKDGSVRQKDLRPGTVKLLHKADGLQAQINALGKQGTAAITQLQQEISSLQSQARGLGPTDTGWVVDNDEGVINSAREADLTLTNQSVTGSSLSNGSVNLTYKQGTPISFQYSYSGGAADGWGAPRVVAEIGGNWYSTMNDVNPVYNTGTQDGGNLWTQSNPLIDAGGNDQQPAPSGKITAIAVVYDNLPAPGTVHVHNLTVGGQTLDFK